MSENAVGNQTSTRIKSENRWSRNYEMTAKAENISSGEINLDVIGMKTGNVLVRS